MKSLEHAEQVALFKWAELNKKRYPELEWLFAVPNAAKRSPQLAAYMKAEGLKAGVPDVILPCPKNGFGGLYIELKAGKNQLTEKQLDWQEALITMGNRAITCWGWQSAKNVIEEYLK